MKQSKSISGINHHYPMGMHVAMQDQLYGLIQPIAPEKIALEPTDIPSWKADIEQERELVRETTAAEESASIIEKDKKRDEVITSIFQKSAWLTNHSSKPAKQPAIGSASWSTPTRACKLKTKSKRPDTSPDCLTTWTNPPPWPTWPPSD